MALTFAIDPTKGETFEDAEQKRKDARMMIASALAQTPRNVGEGLSAIGKALIARQMDQEASTAAKTNAAANSSIMQDLLGIAPFPVAPGGGGTVAPAADAAPTDVPSQRVAQAFGDGQQGFIDSLLPAAMNASKATGVDPRIIVAQAALESGYGKHAPGNNLFGIKSHGQPGGNTLATTEVVNGQPVRVQDSFRAYASPADSVQGYTDFINSNPRYGDLKSAQGLDAQLQALGASGYATDPAYAAKVGSIARGIQLPQTAADATAALAAGQTSAPPMAPPVNIPNMPVAPQPIQVAQNVTPGQMSDADALQLLGATPYNPQQASRAAIAKALSNPAASPTTQRIAAILLEQQMKAAQPKDLMSVGPGTTIFDPNTRKQVFSAPFKPDTLSPDALAQQIQLREAGKPSTVINNNPESSMFAGLPKDVRDEMFKRQSEAQDSADLIGVTNQGLQLLDQGAITGAGSGAKVAAIKWAQTLGVDVPQDIVSAANNTETYRSIMAKAVGKVIKNFGSGTGLSDADRQYAERLAGGDTTLNEPAIRRILAAGAKQAQEKIEGFSTMRDKVLKGDLGAMLNVNEPPAYTPPPTSGTTSGGLKWSIEP